MWRKQESDLASLRPAKPPPTITTRFLEVSGILPMEVISWYVLYGISIRYYYCFTCIRNNWNQVSRCFTSNALSIIAWRMCAWVFPILCPIRIAARMPVSITMARPGKQNAHVVISGVLCESPYIPSQITPTPHPIKHIKKHKHGSYAWFRANIASDDCFVIVFIICIIHLVLLHGQV